MKPGQHQLMRRVEDGHWWYQVLRGLVVDALQRHAQGGRRLLDAGCGTGGMLARLGDWETRGCDLSAEAVELCRELGRPCSKSNSKCEHSNYLLRYYY